MSSTLPFRDQVIAMAYATDIDSSAEAALVKTAHLDDAHLGDIIGAFGTIARNDTTHRLHWKHRLRS